MASVDLPHREILSQLARGRQLHAARRPEDAMPHFQRAFEQAILCGADALAIDAAHLIAIAEPSLTKQNEWNLRAISIAEQSTDPKARGWLASLCDNLGWAYHDSGQYQEALIQFQKALAARDCLAEDSSIRIAEWAVARALRSLKRFDEALEIQTRLMKEYERLGETDSYVYEELGELYEAKGASKKAEEFFALAYEAILADAWLKKNEPQRLARLVQKISVTESAEA